MSSNSNNNNTGSGANQGGENSGNAQSGNASGDAGVIWGANWGNPTNREDTNLYRNNPQDRPAQNQYRARQYGGNRGGRRGGYGGNQRGGYHGHFGGNTHQPAHRPAAHDQPAIDVRVRQPGNMGPPAHPAIRNPSAAGSVRSMGAMGSSFSKAEQKRLSQKEDQEAVVIADVPYIASDTFHEPLGKDRVAELEKNPALGLDTRFRVPDRREQINVVAESNLAGRNGYKFIVNRDGDKALFSKARRALGCDVLQGWIGKYDDGNFAARRSKFMFMWENMTPQQVEDGNLLSQAPNGPVTRSQPPQKAGKKRSANPTGLGNSGAEVDEDMLAKKLRLGRERQERVKRSEAVVSQSSTNNPTGSTSGDYRGRMWDAIMSVGPGAVAPTASTHREENHVSMTGSEGTQGFLQNRAVPSTEGSEEGQEKEHVKKEE